MMEPLSSLEALAGAPPSERLPVLFLGHGNPMNAIADTPYARGWREVAAGLPSPAAVVCISAHWLTQGTFVTAMQHPKTIHDFYGFPEELFRVQYPAPGNPALADEIVRTNPAVRPDQEWGLDHGTWSVLVHIFPEADVPVVQVSIDMTESPENQYETIRALRPLRDRGVLFVGSGNIVHNLRTIRFYDDAEPFDWAREFDETAAGLIASGDHAALMEYGRLGPAARMAVPTDDHYRPMLASLALILPGEEPRFFNEGIDLGSIGMRSFIAG